MKKILILLLLLSGCASPPVKWDKTEKIMMSSLITLNYIDYRQTIEILENPPYHYERNPIIRKIGKKWTPVYFGACTIGSWWIADKFKPIPRKLFLGISDIIQFYTVYHNYNSGIRIEIKFKISP